MEVMGSLAMHVKSTVPHNYAHRWAQDKTDALFLTCEPCEFFGKRETARARWRQLFSSCSCTCGGHVRPSALRPWGDVDRSVESFFGLKYRIANWNNHWCQMRSQTFGIYTATTHVSVQGLFLPQLPRPLIFKILTSSGHLRRFLRNASGRMDRTERRKHNAEA